MNQTRDLEQNQELLEGVAIIGMAGRFPGATNVEEFWQNLQDGVESLSLFTDEELLAAGIPEKLVNDIDYVKVGGVLDDVDLFDAAFFDLNPKETELMDPQHRLFLECAWSAMENAGYDSTKCDSRVGVYAGASLNQYLTFDINRDQIGSGEAYQKMIGNDKGFLATRVSYKLNLTGPSITVQTACSTSLVAATLAYQSLQNYQCDMVLAGGVSINLPQKSGYFYEPGGPLSPDGHCYAFDARAQGTTAGNGVGVVVLKRVEDAIADGDCIYGVIKGAAINNDGAQKIGYTAPSVDGQAEVIAEALMLAEVEPDTIDYIEAHGSGTALGDPIEIAALNKVFHGSTAKNFCALGSVKTNIGHLDAAAGVAGLIKTTLALKHQLIPPSLNFEQPNPQIDFDNSPFYVNTKLAEWTAGATPRRAGVSSLAMGGTNVHIVLEEAPQLPATDASRPWQLLMLSAKTESALAAARENLSQHLSQHPNLNLADVTYTLQVGRRDFSHRSILVCTDTQDAVRELSQPASPRVLTQLHESRTPSVAFIFPGEETFYANMAQELYQTESVFRTQVERCCHSLEPELNLLSLIYPGESPTEKPAPQIAKLGVFVIEYALAQLWMSWGIAPAAVGGQGIGEYVAATIAGVFTPEEALKLLRQELTADSLAQVELKPPTVPLISRNSGTWITEAEAVDPNYWTQPAATSYMGLEELGRNGRQIILEVGYGNNLSTERQALEKLTVLSSLPNGQQQDSDLGFLLSTLGQLWLSGIKVDWSSFYAEEHRQRLPLPTYPFERQSYWIETPASPKLPEQHPGYHAVEFERYSTEVEYAQNLVFDKKPNLADWFYIPVWKQSLPQDFDSSASVAKLHCLVFLDQNENEVGAAFADRLKQQGQDTILVRRGSQFKQLDQQTYEINPQRAEDYDLLLQEIQNFKLNAVGHFWSVTEEQKGTQNELDDSQYLGFYSLLFLAQAIGRQKNIGEELKLLVVTNNLYDVVGSENLCPQKATILGPCKLIPKEYQNISCTMVDVALDSSAALSDKIIDELTAELTRPQTSEIFAYRGSRRWVQTFEPVSIKEQVAGKAELREGGVYLITGGLGGIGLVLAEHLATTVQAKLILVGRRGLPDRSEWEPWLLDHDGQDTISSRIQKVRSLEGLGAEVIVKSADVTNHEQMQSVVAQSIEQFGQINGVIHAAGIPGGGVAQLKTAEQVDSVFAPKVQGTLILSDVCQNIDLDFMVLCSSKTSILGEFGQIDYCAANAFLDAYALSQTAQAERLTTSISWDTWQEVGFAVEMEVPERMQQQHDEMVQQGIFPQEGVTAFDRILGSRLPHVAVSNRDLPTLIWQTSSYEYWERQLGLTEDKLASGDFAKIKHPRPNLGNDYVAPETEVEVLLADIWQEIIGIDQIGIYDNFFELGGNSINAIQIAAKASKGGVKLTSQQFFHYQTIAELAADLALNQGASIGQDGTPITIPLTPIQRHFFAQNQQEPHRCSQSLVLEIEPTGDHSWLELALQSVIQHYQVFRLSFSQTDSGWQQVSNAASESFELSRIDLSSLPEREQSVAIDSIAAELTASLNLSEQPLAKFSYFDLGETKKNRLLMIIHELLVDRLSWRILLEDLQTAYQQLATDQAVDLPDNSTSYIRWVQQLQEYAQSPKMLQEQEYWLPKMQQSFSQLPVDCEVDYEAGDDHLPANTDTVSVSLEEQDTTALIDQAHQAYNTQTEDILLTALVKAFASWTGEAKLKVDIRRNIREKTSNDLNLSRTVGSLTTSFPAFLELTPASEPGDAIIAIKEYLRNIPSSGIGYSMLQYMSREDKIASPQLTLAPSQVSFTYIDQG
ncbi:MAG: SDR family NAD(P)-dependent oxidoreductase [Cyanobacteria bacterium J06558_2]